jgi:hypothetical protein
MQVSTSVRLGYNASAQILARGSNLDTDNPNYYSLSLANLSTGLDLRLERVNSGVTTTLGEVLASGVFNNPWMIGSLRADGTHLQVQIFNTNTAMYLSSSGTWQTNAAIAIDLKDKSPQAIVSSGLAGLGQLGGGAGSVNFDNFSVLSLPDSVSVFPSLQIGTLPSNWSQYITDPSTRFTATNVGIPDLSTGLVVASGAKGLSRATARAWLSHDLPSDGVFSADIALNSIPAQLLCRGILLNTASPSYYVLSLARDYPGPQALLMRVNGGVSTTLGVLDLSGYMSGGSWVNETLVLKGNHLQAQFLRQDTNQYLNSAGKWQKDQAFAFDLTDRDSNALTGGGNAGIGRPVSYVGTLTFAHLAFSVPSEVESFDGSTPGTNPSGWSQARSDNALQNPPTFVIATPPAGITPLSGDQVLASIVPSGHVSGLAWNSTLQLMDATVSAGIYVDSPTPLQVLARGRGLGTATPTYYALSLTQDSPTRLQIQKVINGVTTTLPGGTLELTYITRLWVQATLYVNGSSIRAQLYRSDTGQYLNDHGIWQTAQTWAINIVDNSIKLAGQTGLYRGLGTAAPVYFDNFVVSPLTIDNVPPAVSISSAANTNSISGVQTFTATVSDNVAISHVAFYVDDVLHAVVNTAPFTWIFDTSGIANGTHKLVAKAFDIAENFAFSAPITFTVQNNTTVAPPSLPSHYSHIRIAELAYGGTPQDDIFTHLLASSVDLVIPNPAYLASVNSQSPGTPKLIYANVSNIYQSSLTDWLSYANAHGMDREQAFYHVAAATPFSGSSPSSRPVDQFWVLYRGGSTLANLTSLTASAQGNIAFGATNESLYEGNPDPFREINVSLAAPKLGGSIVLQYAKSVDANGNPTGWADVPLISDLTAGLTQSGRITFDPPPDWKPASVGGSARLYYVRFLTKQAGSEMPVANFIRRRDYVGAHGTTSGIIPAFDAAADLNHDGYLSDAEYNSPNRDPGKTARFLYESRLFAGNYGQMRFATDVSNPSFRSWAIVSIQDLLTNYPLANGIFMDNSSGKLPAAFGTVQEATDSYSADYGALLNGIGRAITPRWVLPNTAGGNTSADPVAQGVQAYYEEFAIKPQRDDYATFDGVVAQVARRARQASTGTYAVIDSRPDGGSPTDARMQLATLASYYQMSDSTRTFLDFYGGFEPNTTWSRHWSPAAAYDIGQPTGPSTSQVGVDSLGFTYHVYQRAFANGAGNKSVFVLYKPLSYNGHKVGLLTDPPTSYALPGTYRQLNADGTVDPKLITSISLSNGQGAILIAA